MNKVDKFFTYYGRWVLFPILMILLGNLFYLYVSQPESFVYICDYKGGYIEPVYSDGVYFYGIKLHNSFLIPRLSPQECARKDFLNDRLNLYGGLCLVALLALLVYKYRFVIRKVWNNERL